MAERYARGIATPAEFCGFYAQTLAGARPDAWQGCASASCATSSRRASRPRRASWSSGIGEDGDRVVLTTATNRFLVELTAIDLGIDDLLATEVEVVDGAFTGRNTAC